MKFFLVFVIAVALVRGEQEIANSSKVEEEKSASTPSSTPGNVEITSTTVGSQDVKKLTRKRCARDYNMNCLKVDLISSVEKLGRNTDLQLLPGVKIVSNADAFLAQKSMDTKMEFSADNVGQQLDELLARRLISYAKSLSLNIQIFDKDEKKGKSIGTSVLENLFRKFTVEGRAEKKSKWGSTLMTAAVLTGGTLLWMGLSSLMAMATKALAASLLSIIISCVTAYRSSGHSHKSTTYEIVAKPVYSHAYAAELQHEPHSAATGHQYGRNIEWDKVASMSSRSEVQVPIRDDAHQLAYRAHVRPIFKRGAI